MRGNQHKWSYELNKKFLLSKLKNQKAEKKFSHNPKKFFGWIVFLNSCENLQVRPKINGFYRKRKFDLDQP